jgi:GT2 family glycosyltransferase
VDLSIIILNYNTYKLTCQCIESVIHQTNGVEYEIILVDNASVECDACLFKEKFPGIILIESKVNLGFSKGNKLGIQHAKGEYILLLNSDTELRNNAILLSFERIKQDSKIGVLSSKLIYPDGNLQYPANRFPSLKTELRELFRLNKKLTIEQRSELFLGSEFDHLTERECDWVWGTFFMIPKSVLDTFPEKKLPDDFFMYAEDLLWCWQIKDSGYKILYYPHAEVVHHIAASSNVTDGQAHFFQKIFPNVLKVIKTQRGKLYAFIFVFTKALLHFSLFNKKDVAKGFSYLSILIKH